MRSLIQSFLFIIGCFITIIPVSAIEFTPKEEIKLLGKDIMGVKIYKDIYGNCINEYRQQTDCIEPEFSNKAH